MTRASVRADAQVAGQATGKPTGKTSACARQKGARKASQRRAGGAPKGNTNAVRHGGYLNLNQKRHEAGVRQDRWLRAAHRRWRRILVARGMVGDDLAQIIASEGTFQLATRRRIESHLSSRGYFRRDGELKPAVSKALEVSASLVDRCAKLLEQLHANRSAAPPGDRTFRVSTCTCDAASPSPLPAETRSAPDEHEVSAEERSRAPAPPALQRGPRLQSSETAERPKAASEDPLGLGWMPLR
jgi:hypothetical protein